MVKNHGQKGFTLVELMIVFAVLGVLSAFALSSFLSWMPDYYLKIAARDLYSNLQKAKMEAVKNNSSMRVRFDSSVSPGFYYFDLDNDSIRDQDEYFIDLASYNSGVDYGVPDDEMGSDILNWNGSACSQTSLITYSATGTSNSGTVFLINRNEDIGYAITARSSGSIKLRKYNGNLPFDTANWLN